MAITMGIAMVDRGHHHSDRHGGPWFTMVRHDPLWRSIRLTMGITIVNHCEITIMYNTLAIHAGGKAQTGSGACGIGGGSPHPNGVSLTLGVPSARGRAQLLIEVVVCPLFTCASLVLYRGYSTLPSASADSARGRASEYVCGRFVFRSFSKRKTT